MILNFYCVGSWLRSVKDETCILRLNHIAGFFIQPAKGGLIRNTDSRQRINGGVSPRWVTPISSGLSRN
ncbi:MAG: hypothetical protein CO189_08125 [candidate division Zixibacteria bacterium CG_4_9_14_3_um_filter_46_8]|nr:MAG: hypothetical protein CO189_08125 [candidate division Zixibacteria bacterium CG_4_9_14_3_um_filter_46_8]